MNFSNLIERPTFMFTWLILLVLATLLYLLIHMVSAKISNRATTSKVRLLMGSLLITTIAVEGLLRISRITENNSEVRLGHYSFFRHGTFRDTIYVWPANETHEIGDRVQFLYPRTTNSVGLSDRDWSIEKSDSSYRIAAFGDSFTEGDGAPADSSWPKLLEQQLRFEGKRIEVMNAGVCGSDPFQSLMLLKYRLVDYKPDLAIITISMQDFLDDIAIKGGMERFDPKRGSNPKLYEVVYAVSHIARLLYHNILGYSWVLVNENSLKFRNKLINEYIPQLTSEFSLYQSEHPSIRIIMVLYPHQMQIDRGYDKDLRDALIKDCIKEGIPLVDLLPCYRQHIEERGIETSALWWKDDGHHNSDGYLMMANCVRQELRL